MKTTNFILAALFALFAYFQLNDPDPFQWVAVYGCVALLCLLAGLGRHPRPALLLVASVVAVWMAILVPGFVEWIRMGMPSITTEMRTDRPHIEVVREFLGLALAMAALVFLWIQSRRAQGAPRG